jgi:hypothetical protein
MVDLGQKGVRFGGRLFNFKENRIIRKTPISNFLLGFYK